MPDALESPSMPCSVEDHEDLGHRVFSSKQKKRAENGTIVPSVFMEDPPTEISTDRLTYAPEQKAVALGDEHAANLEPIGRRTFYGWAILLASKAAEQSRTVCATPTTDNPYHADIRLPENAVNCEARQKFHARQLAERACWRPRPEATL